MKPLSITWVTLVGFVCALLSFLGFFAHMRAGGTPLIVTPGPAVVFAVATALLIWSGLAVRRLRANKDTWIDAIGAMRVAVFARASAIVGSVLAGVPHAARGLGDGRQRDRVGPERPGWPRLDYRRSRRGTLVRHQPRRRWIVELAQAQRRRLKRACGSPLARESEPAPSVSRAPMARAGIVDAWLTSVRIPPGDPRPVAPRPHPDAPATAPPEPQRAVGEPRRARRLPPALRRPSGGVGQARVGLRRPPRAADVRL